MFRKSLIKPDGRSLQLYSRKEIKNQIVATNPKHGPIDAKPHLRWHPLRKEWVIYASHREGRTFLPPPEYSPLNPSNDPGFPTELPKGDYEVAVFENLYPSMKLFNEETKFTKFQASEGQCEVIVFTQESQSHFKNLDTEHIQLILEVLAERTQVLAKDKRIKYVMPFENRGIEMGVTLHHPHGQIYAYSFIPPVVDQIEKSMKEYYIEKGNTLIHDMIINEIKTGERVILENDEMIAFIPECARYPYETWITSKKAHSWLHQLNADELFSLAHILKKIVTKYDNLWERPFPYLMIFYQAPVDEANYDHFHFYIQITPPYRGKDRLKFLAGTELGAGVFVNDSLPEEKAAELRAIKIE